ncbi:cytochrome b/b6 domain-containing protein [Oryzomicrobium sp.]|uniref:cytochrome b/b6 domain-containing protein n=1 Tax=Oryzomicrobium sp. TaxID=1911578 RepID=UPI002FDF692F
MATTTMHDPAREPIHPGWLRLTHWINALAVIVLVLSGWRIYDASPIFHFAFPHGITLGGWLGGALLWHFAAMWVLAFNGLVYLALNLATGRLWHKFFPLRPRDLLHDLGAALRGHLAHDDLRRYNAVQKLAYLFVIADTVLIVLSGLVVWKSVQFPLLRELMGGFDNARVVHFFAMAGLVAFFAVHVVMVALVPRTLRAMIRGR